jgi:hypothetical protein
MHRIAGIHHQVRLSRTVVYRSHGTRLLIRFSARSERRPEIPHICTGPFLEFNANQIGGAPPLSLPRSDLSIMSESIPSTLGAVFMGTNIAGVCVPFSTSICPTNDETNHWTGLPVLCVHKCQCISDGIGGIMLQQNLW